ncbi:uncharacterized protein LOC100897136 [Galendromus occidentalis]|uniref:Uncharacterized protein LOC100897136 n=1 Tax=Galendromus occidentalis TaxID=34638 RepID=A0AAJ6QMD7_9ACAR|nr:uncharacterized protein LOC100897136 [Galendromus occidentalis]
MGNFDPGKFVGKWWLIRVTERVFNNDEDCAHFVVTKKQDNIYHVVSQFHKTKSDTIRELKFDVVDEREEPAVYDLLINGKKFVEVKILGTDYDNWAAIYIQEGTYSIYAIASRGPKLDAQHSQAVNEIMKANNVNPDFQEVNGACPDTI